MRKQGSWLLLVVLTPFCLAGCGNKNVERMHIGQVRTAVQIHTPEDTTPLLWDQFIEQAGAADVVVLGEMHDDHVGHLVQLAVVEDLLARSTNVLVAMEMLERDEQPLVDDYRDGLIDQATFTKKTESGNWAGEGSWQDWYLPIIDAAHTGGGRVIAANAPRRYVRTARKDGWERLKQLPNDRRAYVQWPDPPIEGAYKERFIALMGDHEATLDDQVIESWFRAQTTWDATMAESVAQHHPPGGTTVLLIGQFHSNLDGGTVQMLRRYMPEATLLVVCLRPDQDDPPDDPSPADLIVETGYEAR